MTTKSFGRIATAAATTMMSVATVAGVAHAVAHDVEVQQDALRSQLGASGSPDGQQPTQVDLGTTTTTTTFTSNSRLGFPTDTMADYLQASASDVGTTWVRLFSGWGYAAPTAYVTFPSQGESVDSCGKASDDSTMEYCQSTDTITFSQEAATELWQGDFHRVQRADSGGMAVSLIVAHEYGHNIEDELGLWGNASAHDAAARERGADCFAGVWAQDAATRGLLSTADVAAAYAALDEVAEHPELGASDNGIHGTTAERQQAYTIGAQQGAKACVDAYLSTLGQ